MKVKDFLRWFSGSDCSRFIVVEFAVMCDEYSTTDEVIAKFGDRELESFDVTVYNYEEPQLVIRVG